MHDPAELLLGLPGAADLAQVVPRALDLGVQTPTLRLLVSGHAGLCQGAPNLANKFLVVLNPFGLHLVVPNLDWLEAVTLGHITLWQGVAHHADTGMVVRSENRPVLKGSHELLCLVLPCLADLD